MSVGHCFTNSCALTRLSAATKQSASLCAGGPLGWLYPSEIQPLETRSAGQGIATLVNLLFSFVIGQTYLTMLCSMKVSFQHRQLRPACS